MFTLFQYSVDFFHIFGQTHVRRVDRFIVVKNHRGKQGKQRKEWRERAFTAIKGSVDVFQKIAP